MPLDNGLHKFEYADLQWQDSRAMVRFLDLLNGNFGRALLKVKAEEDGPIEVESAVAGIAVVGFDDQLAQQLRRWSGGGGDEFGLLIQGHDPWISVLNAANGPEGLAFVIQHGGPGAEDVTVQPGVSLVLDGNTLKLTLAPMSVDAFGHARGAAAGTQLLSVDLSSLTPSGVSSTVTEDVTWDDSTGTLKKHRKTITVLADGADSPEDVETAVECDAAASTGGLMAWVGV